MSGTRAKVVCYSESGKVTRNYYARFDGYPNYLGVHLALAFKRMGKFAKFTIDEADLDFDELVDLPKNYGDYLDYIYEVRPSGIKVIQPYGKIWEFHTIESFELFCVNFGNKEVKLVLKTWKSKSTYPLLNSDGSSRDVVVKFNHLGKIKHTIGSWQPKFGWFFDVNLPEEIIDFEWAEIPE